MGWDVEAHESSDGVLLVLDATSINITFVEQNQTAQIKFESILAR